ncbi:DUF6092 family protein [Halanaerobium hydrogeniformans]|uniref:Uncharacterized protein n=1 Tax=Halanaerobium hydrogeniformans TaxID=656519 RepID=E4RP88_HALHG|nr:DUF6092 family protein [Halanaerobium hydrogeniformans]ADQ13773.1 hypothetical protein Halsa_0297 [Halanaerobium hydrogeniformans]
MSELSQKEVLKLISHMTTSARGLIDEPKSYGPFRLIDSTIKLYQTLEKADVIKEKNETDLDEIISELDEIKRECLAEDCQEDCAENLDSIINKLVVELNKEM